MAGHAAGERGHPPHPRARARCSRALLDQPSTEASLLLSRASPGCHAAARGQELAPCSVPESEECPAAMGEGSKAPQLGKVGQRAPTLCSGNVGDAVRKGEKAPIGLKLYRWSMPPLAFAARTGNHCASLRRAAPSRHMPASRTSRRVGVRPPLLPPRPGCRPAHPQPSALPARQEHSIPDSQMAEEAGTWPPPGFQPLAPARCEEKVSVLRRGCRARGEGQDRPRKPCLNMHVKVGIVFPVYDTKKL